MKDIFIFQRVETKYRLTPDQKEALLAEIGPRLTPDAHAFGTVCSLYLDTPDRRILRTSIEGKTYKEKLRLRAYGTPTRDTDVFLEIKKKYKGVVYKRRVLLPLKDAMAYIAGGEKPVDSQIMSEIDCAMSFWQRPQPVMLIAYEREAWYASEDPQLRITFDTNVRCRERDPDLTHGHHGTRILPEDAILMEVKAVGAMPLWLCHALTRCGLLPTHFSKYRTAYQTRHPDSPVLPCPTETRGDPALYV